MRSQSAPATTRKKAQVAIEEIARRKGTFTEAFRHQAEDEAKQGRRHMQQAVESGEEVREDLNNALKMYENCIETSYTSPWHESNSSIAYQHTCTQTEQGI